VSRFWRQLAGRAGFDWWGRCDLCRWSGPAYRFDVWVKGEDVADVCDHAWCQNEHTLQHLVEDGWRCISDHKREAS
jgi:hypothetical protein